MIHNYNYNKPRQLVSETEKKSFDWIKKNVDYYVSAAISNRNSFFSTNRDVLCHQRYRGDFKNIDFSYITKEYGEEYPVKMKDIPLFRPKIMRLAGEELERPKNYHVVMFDEDSLREKEDKVMREMYASIYKDVEEKLEYFLKKGLAPKTNAYDKKYIKTLEERAKAGISIEKEVIYNKLARYFEQQLELVEFNNKLFIETLVTGKPFWKVESHRAGADPSIRKVEPYNLFYPSEDAMRLKDRSWVAERVWMTVEEIIDVFGDELGDAAVKEIEDLYASGRYSNNVRTVNAATINKFINPDSNVDEDSIDYDILNGDFLEGYSGHRDWNKIEVYYVQWKSVKKMRKAQIKNPHNADAPFIKLFESEVRKNRTDVESVENRYIQELYEGVYISVGNGYYVRCGKSPYQIRRLSNPYYVDLHYDGLLFQEDNDEAYSAIYAGRHLEDRYRILHYMEDKMVALSGVKGQVYDLSQLPSDYNLKEVLYYRKLGLLLFESTKDSNFNQFTTYDDTLGAGIGVLRQMMQATEDQADLLIGLNRQRMGEMFQKDLTGQIDRAIKQGAYSTEVLYRFQDNVYKYLLEDILNFAKLSYRDQIRDEGYKTMSYTLGDGRQEIFTLFDDAMIGDAGLFFSNSGKEMKIMEDLKALVSSLSSQGQIGLREVIKIMKATSSGDMTSKLLASLEEQEKELADLQAQQQQAGLEQADPIKAAELEAKMKMLQLEIESKKEIKALELQVKKMELEERSKIEREKIESKEEIEVQKNKLRVEQTELERRELELSAAGLLGGNKSEVKNTL